MRGGSVSQLVLKALDFLVGIKTFSPAKIENVPFTAFALPLRIAATLNVFGPTRYLKIRFRFRLFCVVFWEYSELGAFKRTFDG